MLVFVASDSHQYTFREVLETRRHAHAGRGMILSWNDFLGWPRLPVADYIFTDLERLTPGLLVAAAARVAALEAAAPQLRMLNRPDPRLARLQVMARLHAAGVNRFRVVPAAEAEAAELRFPVFVRRLDDHEGPMSALLPDAAALRAALAEAGTATGALAVTEYINARDADGHHVKFSYFRVGDRLFPSALDLSRNWVCKGVLDDPDTVEDHAREQAFLLEDPHATELMAAFEAAGIGYGRADYAMADGRPQLFEINTNPLLDYPEALPPGYRAYGLLLVERWLAAIAAFSPPGEARRPDWVAVAGAIPRPEPVAGFRLRRTVRSLLGGLGQLHNEMAVMRSLRAAGIAR